MSWLSRRARRGAPTIAEGDLRTAWQAVSLLLEYPSDTLMGQLPLLDEAAHGLPPAVREPLRRLIAHLTSSAVDAIRSDYVDTFDCTRKCSLYLTYFAHGDTRKRGVALVQVKQAYRRAGLIVSEDELPDHLSVVLEFGATADVAVAWTLLNDHRAGIEMLRLALAERGSPWLDAVLALEATLPPLGGDEEDAVARLLAQGPPGEEVGMDAYSLDPALNPHPAADDAGRRFIGMPDRLSSVSGGART